MKVCLRVLVKSLLLSLVLLAGCMDGDSSWHMFKSPGDSQHWKYFIKCWGRVDAMSYCYERATALCKGPYEVESTTRLGSGKRPEIIVQCDHRDSL